MADLCIDGLLLVCKHPICNELDYPRFPGGQVDMMVADGVVEPMLQSEGVPRADFCDEATVRRLVQLLGAPRRAVALSAAGVLAQTCGATHLRQEAAAEAGAVRCKR